MALEDDLPNLKCLGDARDVAYQLRDEALLALTAGPYTRNRRGWRAPGDFVEYSLVLRTIRVARRRQLKLGPFADRTAAQLTNRLTRIAYRALFDSSGDAVPVLRAARIMQALVACPERAFSATTLFCYYRILRELYTAGPPMWRIGGARAGDGAEQTAFVTRECIRAILSLRRALVATSDYFMALVRWTDRMTFLCGRTMLPAWAEVDNLRATLDYAVGLERLAPRMVFRIPPLSEVSSARRHLQTVEAALSRGIEMARRQAMQAEKRAKHIGKRESGEAHQYALGEVGRLRDLGLKFSAHRRHWKTIAAATYEVAAHIDEVLRPATSYVLAVVERELAASQSQPRSCDTVELAFAASAYGVVTERWDDPRIVASSKLVQSGLSEKGTLRGFSPIQVKPKGYRLSVIAAEVTTAVADLVARTSAPLDQELSAKLLRLFRDTRAPTVGSEIPGWSYDQAGERPCSEWWATSIAAHALDHVGRMLSARINAGIFQHFSVRTPQKKALRLESIIYPDYGMHYHTRNGRQNLAHDSLAAVMQQARAHILGVRAPKPWQEPRFSMLLYGPPGTGKTTLLEALAATAGVPFVEVTPSDIVSGGAEAVEHRCKTVFAALSLVSRCVILFDEFDPILLRRDANERTPSNVFAFLTPGMLPKLKSLFRASKARHVVYALATNRIGALDEAAIRAERFDTKVGVFPPDLLSRAGRGAEITGQHCSHGSRRWDRMARVIAASAGGSMPIVAQPGWLGGWDIAAGGPVGYVAGATKWDKGWELEPEECRPVDKVKGSGRHAAQEWVQWTWIDKWDADFRAARKRRNGGGWLTLKEVLNLPPVTAVAPIQLTTMTAETRGHCRRGANQVIADEVSEVNTLAD